ncbi:MAG TPA: F0F1 ATP synthase subunit B [Actinomycetota bacterium]
MHGLIATLLLAAEEVSDKKDIYPKLSELIIGALAFAVLFFFLSKWAMPRINGILEERRKRIQGDLEKAEQAKNEAENLLSDYREQLAGAREDANRIIEEARRTAEAMRKDLMAKAEQEYQGIVGRAQEEIRAERDRVFQELKTQVGELSLALAGRVVGETLDKTRQLRLVDDYIKELEELAPSNGKKGSRRRDSKE